MAELTNQSDWNALLDQVDTFLVDCDGVLWTGDNDAVPGAKDAIAFLKSQGKSVFYVSNNSGKSRKQYLKKFEKLGFSASLNEVFPTSFVAAHYLRHTLNVTGTVYLHGMEGFAEEISQQGINVIGVGLDPMQGTLSDWLKMQLDPPSVDAVVVGLDWHTSYMKWIRMASYLANPSCHFVATNEDALLPTKGSIKIPETGVMVSAMTTASNREPTLVGKPHEPVYDAISSFHSIDRDRTCMIGDQLNTDIAFGRKNHLKTLLVYSGNVTREQYGSYHGDNIADYTSESLATVLQNKS